MKATFISFGQSLNDSIMELFDKLEIRGFTRWDETFGRGSETGEAHYGTHAFPTKNSTVLAVTTDDKAALLMEKLRHLNEQTEEQGLNAFVWNVEEKI